MLLMLDPLFYTISLTSLFVNDRTFWHMLKIIQQFSINQGNLERGSFAGHLKWETDKGWLWKQRVSLSLSLSLSLCLWELWEEKLVGFSFSGDPEGCKKKKTSSFNHADHSFTI